MRARARRDGPFGLGDHLEFGVYRGDSLLCMQRASERTGFGDMRLFGFDSFEGMPSTEAPEDRAMRRGGGLSYRPGALRSPQRATVDAMTRQGADWGRISVIPGWFNETLVPGLADAHGIQRAAVIMLDCVLHSSTMAALSFCEPLIRDETIVFLDDWDAGSELAAESAGERRAFEEFIAAHPSLVAEPIGSYLHEEDEKPSVAMIMLVRRVRSVELH